jgi:hypothetical protein
VLIGTDEAPPPARLEGMCEYVLDEELSVRNGLTDLDGKGEDWQPGDDEGVAAYKWVFDPAWVEQLPDTRPVP